MHSTHANEFGNRDHPNLRVERDVRWAGSCATFGPHDLLVVDATTAAASSCAVCGEAVMAGGGIAALYRGRMLRFRCEACLRRFASDPDRYLGGAGRPCCPDEDAVESPASEWCV